MKTPDDTPRDPLEQWTTQVLRGLPERRAPLSLEARVMAQIGERAARPWWQLSFMDWPVAVRLLFLSGCTATGVLAARAFHWLFGGLASSASVLHSELEPAAASVKATANVFTSIAHNIPAGWVYGALAVVIVLYAGLFGIGAVAYRTLYASR